MFPSDSSAPTHACNPSYKTLCETFPKMMADEPKTETTLEGVPAVCEGQAFENVLRYLYHGALIVYNLHKKLFLCGIPQSVHFFGGVSSQNIPGQGYRNGVDVHAH